MNNTNKGTFLSNYKQRSKKLLVPRAAEALKTLSLEEKHIVDGDLYGTREVVEETDDFIDCKLSELQREIERLDDDLTSAYYQAVALEKQSCANDNEESKYVTSRTFALMFLRCDRFDAQDAARRLTKHFREKLEIFGKDKLASRIQQVDLNDQDKALLSAGGVTITGAKDDHGRIIIFRRQQVLFRSSPSASTAKRALFYILQNAIEECETSQKKGTVLMDFSMGTKTVLPASGIQRLYPVVRMINRGLPIRFSAFHVCYDSLIEHFFFNLGFLLLPEYMKARVQCHYEKTPSQCMEELREYGIDPDVLPVTDKGEFRDDMLKEWLERWSQTEGESRQTKELESQVNSNDLATATDNNQNELPETEDGKIQAENQLERKHPLEDKNDVK